MVRKGIIAVLALLLLPALGDAQIKYVPAPPEPVTVPTAGYRSAFSATELTTATTGTVEEILYTWTIPASTFRQTGGPVGFKIACYSQGANNANVKRLRMRVGGIGGALLVDRTTNAANDYIFGTIECMVATSTSLACETRSSAGAAAGVVFASTVGSITFTNSLAVVCDGVTVTSATDLTLRAASGMWVY